MPLAIVLRAIDQSPCFGCYADGWQVTFTRAVSDYVMLAYLVDVSVLEECRGRGLWQAPDGAFMTHPDLQDLRRFMLATGTAHTLYACYGFTQSLSHRHLIH